MNCRYTLYGLWIAVVAGCYAEQPGGDKPQLCPEDCRGCCKAGEGCTYSINCEPSHICNRADDPLYQPEHPEGVCTRVDCDVTADCSGERVCTLERICEAPICRSDRECSGGQRCHGGSCVAPAVPGLGVECAVVSRGGVIRVGSRIRLDAAVSGDATAVLFDAAYNWTSDRPDRVRIDDGHAVGGAEEGPAVLTASLEGRYGARCYGGVRLWNHRRLLPGEQRVVVVSQATGRPVPGARVWIDTITSTTGPDGALVLLALGAPVRSVSAAADGFVRVTILAPVSNDVLVPLPRRSPGPAIGGHRGRVDVNEIRDADIKYALVSGPLRPDLHRLGFGDELCRTIPTTINAPDIGARAPGRRLLEPRECRVRASLLAGPDPFSLADHARPFSARRPQRDHAPPAPASRPRRPARHRARAERASVLEPGLDPDRAGRCVRRGPRRHHRRDPPAVRQPVQAHAGGRPPQHQPGALERPGVADRVLVAFALRGDATLATAQDAMSAVVHPIPWLREAETIQEPFLPLPSGVLHDQSLTLELGNADAVGDTWRLTLGQDSWIIYAPSSRPRVGLPLVPGLADAVRAASKARLATFRTQGGYASRWSLGAAPALGTSLDDVRAFSSVVCARSEVTACGIAQD